ncbi:unnamed protein product [Rotaria magnacalcarata]|uniref:Uncharacterized protein n=1 Tax=Rotaria magnacalcarata TaxID=392030 RepID=A0A814WUF2_9BILA|nr:unnamed protein product [Rotaria magnacalcarata]
MYQHIRIALEHAQQRSQHVQEQENIRRRRKTIEKYPTTRVNESTATCVNEDETTSNNPREISHHSLSDHNETLDVDDDFDLDSLEEISSKSQFHFNSDCELSMDDQDEPLMSEELFSSNNDQNDNFLHFYTTTKTRTFCRQMVEIFRDANISNIHCLRILKLISSVLPQPHNSPTTLKALYDSIQVEQLFNKRLICIQCHHNLSHNDKICNKCFSKEKKYIASIFDVNQPLVFTRTLDRLSSEIEDNRKQCNLNHLSRQNNNNDIIFNQVYKKLQNRHGSSSFISLLLHLDGISLCKSSKLNLWLLSCSLIELPVHLRYRRFNMIVLSVWIGHCEPLVDLWLEECFQQLNDIKKKGISTRSGINYKIIVYGLTGDCPAIKLATKHISHQGYLCCWFCYIHGIHVDNKRQYYFEKKIILRSETEYEFYSKEAEKTKTNIYGHLGRSPFSVVFDIPLPRCIVIDYMHVSLLRHTHTIIQYLYQKILKPKQRDELDDLFRHQAFPHNFNRKMRCVKDFSYCKASELRNMLLYGLLPLIRSFLPVQLAAHLALYVAAMRLLHGPRTLGDATEIIANELMINYYRDHQSFYTSIQNFVLHLHVHYANQYRLHGSLSNLGTFGQESLLGHFAKNRHGTHHFGELITNNYNVDFTIHNQPNSHSSSRNIEIDGIFDLHDSSISRALHEYHNALCICDKIDQCISIYRRCRLKHTVYHSLLYRRRGSSVSYFVQYSKGHDDNLFGKIDLFFKCNNKNFALIHNHRLKHLFTDYFLSSNYHDILLKALDVYFYVLHHTSTFTDVVTVDKISNMCIVFTFNDSLVVTPLSSSYEHD